MPQPFSSHDALAARLAGLYAALPQVEAVALSGSRAGSAVDAASDIDLYIYTRAEIPLESRQAIVEACGGASRASLGLTYWGPGDEWYDRDTGIEVDANFFEADWMQGQLERVIDRHEPSLGYTTCFWRTMRNSRVYHDPRGWFPALQREARASYPEALRRNIIAFNHPVLRGIIPAYQRQIEKAVQRADRVSVNHRLAALLASYFDILFAANRVLHPGEKRLVQIAQAECPSLPDGFPAGLEAVLAAAGAPEDDLPARLTRLLDRLDAWLAQAGLLPPGDVL